MVEFGIQRTGFCRPLLLDAGKLCMPDYAQQSLCVPGDRFGLMQAIMKHKRGIKVVAAVMKLFQWLTYGDKIFYNATSPDYDGVIWQKLARAYDIVSM
jgi:hypothetical protein